MRMWMKDHRNWCAGTGTGLETAFKTAFRPWKDDFGHCT
jgi:hypothetical protein